LQTVHGILQESYEILASRHQLIDLECSQLQLMSSLRLLTNLLLRV